MKKTDIIIIGAGAAGLFCAIEAGKRGRQVVILDHANKAGKKILMSGGGRCNFTNKVVRPEHFISQNPHFCKSALSRFTPEDFIAYVKKHRIPFHEKHLGQLFCDEKSQAILNMLLSECAKVNVSIKLNTSIKNITPLNAYEFRVTTATQTWQCSSLVIASGGLSIPTLGASPFGYQLAAQFGIKVWPTRAGLVPFHLQKADLERFAALSGISFASEVTTPRKAFRENSLFTHRGLSGPAMLQASSYWLPGEALSVDLLPEHCLQTLLTTARQSTPKITVKALVNQYLPKRLTDVLLANTFATQQICQLSNQQIQNLVTLLHQWQIKPNDTEGYRTAEVTLGGVDCDALSSTTMMVKDVPGLYFIGEVVDVTGWLGGYNFQWAWASAWAAAQAV